LKTVILGGTFNPPHIGHLFLAEEVASQFGYERVLIVPSFQPSHKNVDGEVTPNQRWEMVLAACSSSSIAEPDDCELQRGGMSYSIDTVESVLKKGGVTGKPGLIIGDDLFRTFSTWKNSDKLLELCELIVAHRESAQRLQYPYAHGYVDNKILPISSTEIRARVRQSLPWRHLVPEAVFHYIESQGLYKHK